MTRQKGIARRRTIEPARIIRADAPTPILPSARICIETIDADVAATVRDLVRDRSFYEMSLDPIVFDFEEAFPVYSGGWRYYKRKLAAERNA